MQAEADIWAIIERGSTNPPTVPGATKPPAEDEENRREWGRLRRNIRIADFFAAFVWIYSATKLFVADVDRMAIHRIFPQADWLVDFRLVFVAALALAVALFFWNKWTMAFVVYIVLFPLLVVVWKIPALIYRRHSWLLAMAVINSAVLFFRNLRFHLITKASVAIAFVVVISSSSPFLLIPADFVLFGMFLWLVWRTALETFSPGWFLTFQQKAVAKLAAQAWGVSQVGHITVVRSEAQSGEIDRAQISSLVAGISLDVAINRGLYFWAYRLQCYSQSQLSSVFNCITYARVFLSAVLTNWLVNTSILKIDVRQFQFSDYPSHVRMLYYSLSALVLNDGGGVAPLGDLAWVSRLAWGIFGILVLVTFLANIVFVWTRERDDAMLKSTVDELKRRAREHDAAFKEQMEVGVAEAARRLLALQGAFGWLLKFVIEGVPPEFMADATE